MPCVDETESTNTPRDILCQGLGALCFNQRLTIQFCYKEDGGADCAHRPGDIKQDKTGRQRLTFVYVDDLSAKSWIVRHNDSSFVFKY